MDKKQVLFEKIEDYLSGRLDSQAADEFRLQIEKDADLEKEVQQHRLERLVLKAGVQDKLHQRMQKWDAEMEQNTSYRTWWWLLLPLLAFLVYWSWPSNVPQKTIQPVEIQNEVKPSSEEASPSEDQSPIEKKGDQKEG